jgi:AcrR family transcriptional regulator
MVSKNAKSGNSAPGRPPLLPQAFVDEHKRERCALALSEVVHEVGVGGMTVTLLTKRARMARNTFYTVFENQEGALRYAYELGNRRLREAVEGVDSGAGALEEAVEALLAAAEKEPYLIELCLVHGCGHIGPKTGPYDQKLVEVLTTLAASRENSREGAATIDELLALSILSLIASCLRRGEASSLTTLSGPIAEFVRIQLGDRQAVGSSQGSALGSG